MQTTVSFIGLFCRRDLNFKEPTNPSHPISIVVERLPTNHTYLHTQLYIALYICTHTYIETHILTYIHTNIHTVTHPLSHALLCRHTQYWLSTVVGRLTMEPETQQRIQVSFGGFLLRLYTAFLTGVYVSVSGAPYTKLSNEYRSIFEGFFCGYTRLFGQV